MYIEDDAYQITELRDDTVQLLPTGTAYPIYRAERKEQFEQLLRADRRNAYYTEFLPIDPDKADQDLRDVLAHGLMDEADKQQISTLLQSGRSNSEIAYWLSRAYSGEIETLNLETGDIADYRTTAQGIELEVMDAEEKRLAMLYFRWDEVAPLLRGMYARQQDGFGREQPEPAAESPTFHSETVAVYPGDKNNLPYDVVVERLHIEEPEPPAPVTEPEKTFEEVLDEHPVSIQVNGQWQTFPNAKAAEEASYEEYKANLRRNAKNFRITDEHLGEGGPKAKFQANVNAIRLLKELEFAGQQASPEQQEVLSRYVGWGGLSDAFEPEKPVWALEYAQLKDCLLYTSTVIGNIAGLQIQCLNPTGIGSAQPVGDLAVAPAGLQQRGNLLFIRFIHQSMSQYIPQVLICLVRVSRKKLGIVSIAAVCPKQLLELFFALCPVDGICHAGGQKLHGVIPQLGDLIGVILDIHGIAHGIDRGGRVIGCLLYTSPSIRATRTICLMMWWWNGCISRSQSHQPL